MVLDGLPGLYGFKYDSATACGLPLYLYSYKLVGSAIGGKDNSFSCLASMAKAKIQCQTQGEKKKGLHSVIK